MTNAPFRADLAEAPEGSVALWRATGDGVRVRVALWPTESARGTVLIFPGRTEYIEKYGRVVRDFAAAGYAAAVIDWRGQGLSDRLADDPALGHVLSFADYQNDVAALVAAAREAGLPEPWHLVAHSMGGCIGLRAMIEDLPVRRAVFSAPMWGIVVPAHKRPVAAVLPTIARAFGQHERYAPGTRPTSYLFETGFEGNLLTTDPDHFGYFSRQIREEPGFALGGPSVHWFGEARKEMARLARLPRPAQPVLTFLGTREEIVLPSAVHRMHRGWSDGRLEIFEGARHELMMEAPEHRDRFLSESLRFLADG